MWLGNTRGNTYSRQHLNYDPDVDKEEFWSWDWDTAGVYDLPASFDYIIENTGQVIMSLICYSRQYDGIAQYCMDRRNRSM